jgi:hypothetical protein
MDRAAVYKTASHGKAVEERAGSRISAAAPALDELPPDFGMERALGLLSSR